MTSADATRPTWTTGPARRDEEEAVVLAVYEVFLDGMGRTERGDPGWVRRRLDESDALALCRDTTGEVVGYGLYSCPPSAVAGGHILWCNAVALRKGWQGVGLVTGLDDKVGGWLGTEPRWIGCRTQNPTVVAGYGKQGRCWPMDETFASPKGRELLRVLRDEVPEVGQATALDEETGVCRRAYRDGRLGDSPSSVLHAPHVDRLFAAVRLDRDAGDALVVVTDRTDPPPARP